MSTDPNNLVLQAQSDPQAFTALYDEYFSRVYNYIYHRCGDVALADDLTAQVFERLLKKIRQFSPERGAFEPWLFALARNLITDHFRRSRFPWLPWETLPQVPAVDPSPESRAVANETESELLSAVARLDRRARDLIGLKFGACLTNRQIAAVAGLSESNVAVILYRAITDLRKLMTQTETGRVPVRYRT